MTWRQRAPDAVVLAGLLGGGMAIAMSAHDATAAFGLALLGAALGAWFVVYDRVMCKNEQTPWSWIGAGAGLGASALPVLAALEFALGDPVWWIALVLVVTSAVANSIHSADKRPHRTAGG